MLRVANSAGWQRLDFPTTEMMKGAIVEVSRWILVGRDDLGMEVDLESITLNEAGSSIFACCLGWLLLLVVA